MSSHRATFIYIYRKANNFPICIVVIEDPVHWVIGECWCVKMTSLSGLVYFLEVRAQFLEKLGNLLENTLSLRLRSHHAGTF